MACLDAKRTRANAGMLARPNNPTFGLILERRRAKRTISIATHQRKFSMALTGIRLKPSACIRSLKIALNASLKRVQVGHGLSVIR